MDAQTSHHIQNDYAGLNAACDIYIVALNNGDIETLSDLFLPESHLYAAYDYVKADGSRMVMPREAFFDLIRERGAPKDQGYKPDGRVVMLDFIEPDTAVAKIEVRVGPRQFTDYLNFIRVDGDWKVIAKVFHKHP
ncbi:MAG: nuclear transport factor 2 family protein [Pseudomonadota bacterium]